jgi:hypothetical protein
VELILSGEGKQNIPHWQLPAVRDLTRDGRWSTYDVSVLKLSNVSFHGKMRTHGMGNTLKLPSPTKLARLGLSVSLYCICLFSEGEGAKAYHR